ncbi:precorrin-6y C5,15-methyltransferase (decarboxylating) subunit CbiE [Hwanghaeella sp.]|uniref:precorrin-6y C5,15-methyltransferase (decarboxylating) subunit CbiE n=1 Tax=Hwanghaeella sp. TaxID=2605943 RepID=UPI003CCB8E0D
MTATPWISVIGLGEDGLDVLPPAVRALVDGAEVLIGGERHLAMVPKSHSARRMTWRSPLRDTIADIRLLAGKKVCVLATGDPMSYGIGVTLGREFGRQALTVIPAPGAFTLAAARLGWPLEQVTRLTVHGRPLDLVSRHLQPGAKLLILSEDGSTPAALAALLVERGYGPSELTVFEHMGGPDEAQTTEIAEKWGNRQVRDLNTVAISCVAAKDTLPLAAVPGLPDESFLHDGQLTKREVRAATLAVLGPRPGALLWDVGTGNGSIAIEWMRAGGRAIGIEPDAERRDRAARNAAVLGVPDLRLVAGRAPDALDGLPAPEAVFIGGGTSAEGLLEYCWAALAPGGCLVANAVTLESETRLAQFRDRVGGEMVRIAVSRLDAVGPYHGWRPLMPVTQLSIRKSFGG